MKFFTINSCYDFFTLNYIFIKFNVWNGSKTLACWYIEVCCFTSLLPHIINQKETKESKNKRISLKFISAMFSAYVFTGLCVSTCFKAFNI